MLFSMKRTGSNHLMCSFQDITNKKLVWFDAPLDTWSTFDLPFQREIWNQNVNWCLNELFDQYSGCKINWDEEGFYNIIDELIEYPIQKILLYRENIWEKVISEELAIQTDHWTSSVGYHRRFKTDYKFDSIDVGVVKERMERAKSQLSYVMNSIGEDLIPYKYEDLFSRTEYTDYHKENFINLLSDLDIDYQIKEIDSVISQYMSSEMCYKTDQTYQNIENFSELEKLKDYLLL